MFIEDETDPKLVTPMQRAMRTMQTSYDQVLAIIPKSSHVYVSELMEAWVMLINTRGIPYERERLKDAFDNAGKYPDFNTYYKATYGENENPES